MVHDLTEAEQRVKARRPRFYAALLALGSTDPERAKALGVQRLTVRKYRLGLATPRYLLDEAQRHNVSPDAWQARAGLVLAYTEDVAADTEIQAA